MELPENGKNAVAVWAIGLGFVAFCLSPLVPAAVAVAAVGFAGSVIGALTMASTAKRKHRKGDEKDAR